MQTNQTVAPINIKIIWGALTASILMYGYVLFMVGKCTHLALPEVELSPLQMAAMGMNLMILVTYFIHRSKIQSVKDPQKKFPLYVLCWALNESVAIVAFLVTFLGEDGNAIFFVINAGMAILGNLLTFPRD